MKKRNTQERNFFSQKLFFILSPLVLVLVFLVGGYVWYQSRAIPDLNEENQMTTLPIDTSHVLAATTVQNQKTSPAIRIPIFMYHYVEHVQNDPGRQNLNIPPEILTEQIETLKNAGYTFIIPNDLIAALFNRRKLPKKVAMLSFDDGYMDDYTNVFPILEREHVSGVFYIVPNFLDRPNYLFTFQLEELAKSSLVEIGAHTMNHYALAGMDSKKAEYEIGESRKFLQNLLHVPINSFAYPYGSFSLETVSLVKDAGFTNAMSVIPGISQSQDNRYFLNRLRPGYRTGKELLKYLELSVFQPW